MVKPRSLVRNFTNFQAAALALRFIGEHEESGTGVGGSHRLLAERGHPAGLQLEHPFGGGGQGCQRGAADHDHAELAALEELHRLGGLDGGLGSGLGELLDHGEGVDGLGLVERHLPVLGEQLAPVAVDQRLGEAVRLGGSTTAT